MINDVPMYPQASFPVKLRKYIATLFVSNKAHIIDKNIKIEQPIKASGWPTEITLIPNYMK